MADPPTASDDPSRISRFGGFFYLTFGMAMTLIVSGYQFGGGNHTVYLLDGLRIVHPDVLANDWFVTHTLQYHLVFSTLTATLMKLHLLRPAFLIGYLTLVALWHVAWRGITGAIGADDRTYLLSVVLFYLSAAGISIGVFQFLQDACFLPSNVANIAMLWGIYCWMLDRRVAAGIWLGVAGLFHVNFAAMTIGLWTVLVGWQWLDGRRDWKRDRTLWWATLAALVPSFFNLGLAVPDELRHGGTMPMGEFVRVYVRFRHAHHFDPLHWPIALWISFLWPIPLAVIAYRSIERGQIRREVGKVFGIIVAILVVAFLFAGVWFVNEPLVQLCLWRFSIFIKLMSCIGAAFWLVMHLSRNQIRWTYAATAIAAGGLLLAFARTHDRFSGMVAATAWDHRTALELIVIMLIVAALNQFLGQWFRSAATGLIAINLLVLFPQLGVGMTPEPADPNYRAVCAWAKANTPTDATFLTPPQETDFRLYAERAIVVNYKHVPQLSGEIVQWQQRLLDVMGLHDLDELPHDYVRTMKAIGATYDARSAGQLTAVAEKYGARFIVIDHPIDDPSLKLVFHELPNPYFVYDRISPTTRS